MRDDKMVRTKPYNRLWFKVLISLVVSFIIVISASKLYAVKGVKEQTSLDEFTSYLDERIPALMNDYGIPGVSISLVHKGRTTWSNAYGYADLESGRKMTVDTYCRVESISKSVTAWGVMKLVEQGKIDLDKPVKQYINDWELPESQFSGETITVRQLLTHTAGMPLGDIFERFSPMEKVPSLKESLSKHAILMQEPGLSFSYSNTGYDLLELLIEEVTGRDFAEYMEKEVLTPIGMHRSSFVWSERLEPGVPVGYDVNGNPVPVYVYPEKASGGLLACVEDIAAFISAGMPGYLYSGNEVLTPEYINLLYTPSVSKIDIYGLVFDSYGMGYYTETLPDGMQAVVNGGQGGGCMTEFYSVPKTGDGIVILTNSQRSWPFFGYILNDWAEWSGLTSVGMGKIIWAQGALWTLIGLILFFILLKAWGLVQGIVSCGRRFAPLSKQFRYLRLLQMAIFLVLVSGIIWCASQKYLFISSVFPTASSWLGISILGIAVILLFSALFPKIEDKNRALGTIPKEGKTIL